MLSLFTLDASIGRTIVRRLYVVGAIVLALLLVVNLYGIMFRCVEVVRYGASDVVMRRLVFAVSWGVGIVVCALAWRVLGEYLLAVFRIAEVVVEIREAQRRA